MKRSAGNTRPRIQARRWEALADGCTDAVVAISMEKRRPAEYQYGEWSARQRGKVERALDAMAEDLGSRTWCCGDFFNLADIAVGCCLGFMELRLPEICGARNTRASRDSRTNSHRELRFGIRRRSASQRRVGLTMPTRIERNGGYVGTMGFSFHTVAVHAISE